MNDTRKATVAGLLILVSIAACVAIVITTANAGRHRAKTSTYVATFGAGSDVQGIDDKSSVRILGVDVGRVKKVSVVASPQGDPTVHVAFTLPVDYTLHHDAKIAVQSQITGGARLNIESLGSSAQPAVAPGGSIAGYTLTLGDVMADLRGLVPQAQSGLASFTATSDSVRTLATKMDTKVDGVVDRYHEVMKTADSALANASDLLGDSKTDLRTTAANLREITGTVKERLPDTLADARALMTRASSSLAKLDPILDDGKAISTQTRGVINDNRANIDQTFTNIRRASVEIKGGIAEIRRAPWRLLKEPHAKDQQNLVLYEAARRFADGAQDLQAAAIAMQLASDDPATDPDQLNQLREALASQISTFAQIRQKLFDQLAE